MANPPKDQSPNIPRAFRKILLQQMKGQEVLDSDELSLFEWYVSERTKTIDLMLTEARAYIKGQIDAGLDLGDVNESGMVAVEYSIKRARYADVIYLTSLLELYLSRASKKLEGVLGDHNVTFRPDELAGNKWARHKKFLERYGKFAFPDDAWATLLTLIEVRNILVHENGDFAATPSATLSRIQKSPGLQADRGELVIEDAYITHGLSAFRSLVEHLNSHINQSIERTLQPQGLKPGSR
jgi:hypothetical protein